MYVRFFMVRSPPQFISILSYPAVLGQLKNFARRYFPMNIIAYGGGVNSTALLIGMHQRGIPADLDRKSVV